MENTNLISDLINIVKEYTRFAGVERLTIQQEEDKRGGRVSCVAVLSTGELCVCVSEVGIIKILDLLGTCKMTLKGKIISNKKTEFNNNYTFLFTIFFTARRR